MTVTPSGQTYCTVALVSSQQLYIDLHQMSVALGVVAAPPARFCPQRLSGWENEQARFFLHPQSLEFYIIINLQLIISHLS